MFRSFFIKCYGLGGWILFLALSARAEPDVRTYTLAPGEAIRDVATRFLGGPEDVYELLKYNGILNPAEVRAGAIIRIPGEERVKAMHALQSAEEAIQIAIDADAHTVAADDYAAAANAMAEARLARREARYEELQLAATHAEALANTARQKAMQAIWATDPARVSNILGTVEISEDNGVTWKGANVGDAVDANALLRTQAHSRCEVTLANGSQLFLSESSQVGASKLQFNRKTGARRTQLKITLGDILGDILPADKKKEGEMFKIDAGEASISIRGTVLGVGADDQGQSRVRLYRGLVDVVAGGRTQELTEGTALTVSADGKMSEKHRLIPAPILLQEGGRETVDQRPILSWKPAAAIPRAREWILEIARDSNFVQIVEAMASTKLQLRPNPLPEGRYYWRVYGMDPQGFKGAPSLSAPLVIRKELQLQIHLPGGRELPTGRWHVRPADLIAVWANPAQPENSIASTRRLLDGEPWSLFSMNVPADGPHEIHWVAQAQDGVDAPPLKLEVYVDNTGPELRVEREVRPGPLGEVVCFVPKATDPSGVACVEWASGAGSWQPLPDSGAEVLSSLAREYRFRAIDALGNISPVVIQQVEGQPVRL